MKYILSKLSKTIETLWAPAALYLKSRTLEAQRDKIEQRYKDDKLHLESRVRKLDSAVNNWFTVVSIKSLLAISLATNYELFLLINDDEWSASIMEYKTIITDLFIALALIFIGCRWFFGEKLHVHQHVLEKLNNVS